MVCIERIYSVSALVGSGACNANCSFCAGRYLRPEAVKGHPSFLRNLEASIKLCARYGGWSLSLTSAGEPTMSPDAVTEALEVYAKCARQGAFMPNVNLFTNGIRFADRDFCARYLPYWKQLGLTNVAVSIHYPSEMGQARAYGIEHYPELNDIFDNIKYNEVGLRCTLLLQKGLVCNADSYEWAINRLMTRGVDNITSWPVGNPDGSRNEFTPSRWGLFAIRRWLHRNAKLCHGHAWGGGVYDYEGNILRLTDYVTRHDPKKDYVRQLVVFQDGLTAYSWVKEGALCMK